MKCAVVMPFYYNSLTKWEKIGRLGETQGVNDEHKTKNKKR